MEMGDIIKRRRKELGLTQTDLAKKIGYATHSAIVRVENGESKVTQSMIPKYAEALECSIPYLFGMPDPSYDNSPDDKMKELESIIDIVGIDQILIYARFLRDTREEK